MIIPDTEEIIYRGSNELKKNKFFMQGFVVSLMPLSLISSTYIFLRAINIFVFFGIVLAGYIILSILTANRTYKYYKQYYGSDEIAISKSKIYYNVCMNINGTNINFDSNKELKEIKEIYIRNVWNPKSLIIDFNDGTHLAIHSLKDIDSVVDIINLHK